MCETTIISSQRNWLEQSAVNQLRQFAKLPGVKKAIGLPDLHPGKTPVGAVFILEDMIYPHLVGNDIGCGMGFFMTNMEKRKFKLDRYTKKIESISGLKEIPLPENYSEILLTNPLGMGLGTIGGGNHFAELQEVETVHDLELFNRLGFDKNQIMLLIHSGSRSYGQTILEDTIRNHQAQNGLLMDSVGAKDYLSKHDDAVKWAAINRDLISYRFLSALGVNSEANRLIDCCHNLISTMTSDNKTLYIHRKGATPSDNGAVVIPGSRGSLTYLVIPTNNQETSGYSLAHGAGRKWERGMCRARLENKYTKETLRSTKLKGRVVCSDNNLLFEEAPEAYKNIDTVIQSLLEFDLINVIATFKPILTYKN